MKTDSVPSPAISTSAVTQRSASINASDLPSGTAAPLDRISTRSTGSDDLRTAAARLGRAANIAEVPDADPTWRGATVPGAGNIDSRDGNERTTAGGPPQIAKAAAGAARFLDVAHRVVNPALAAIDLARLGTAFARDGGHVGAQTIHVAGSVAGSLAGSAAGAEVGALGGATTGAVIGSLFGGVGAVPGAAIGGLIGNLGGEIAGSIGGSWLGAKVADRIRGQ